jgi:poly(3-hydroxybutyrate) depolymerase
MQGNNGGAGGSGVVILAYPSTFAAITTIPGTLTYSVSTVSRSGYRVYTFTGGTGTVTV